MSEDYGNTIGFADQHADHAPTMATWAPLEWTVTEIHGTKASQRYVVNGSTVLVHRTSGNSACLTCGTVKGRYCQHVYAVQRHRVTEEAA